MLQVANRKPQLRGEVLGREAVPALVPAWTNLCAQAVEDNVYYTPRYARALIDNVERDVSLRFAAVWKQDTLIALLPFTRATFETPLLGTAARAWKTDYTFSCMPLLDRACPADAAAGLVDLLSAINEGEWIVPAVNIRGAACIAMIDALEKIGRSWRFSNAFERATVAASGTIDEHLHTHLTSRRRRDLARNRRRLEDIGTLAHECARSGPELTRAVEAFLAIEAGGWKGKRRTALACRPGTRQFALDAFTGAAADSICRADMLTLNGAPIAVGLAVIAGATGFTVKGAYDEAYRSYSAGLLLEVEVLRSLLTERWADRLDAATAGTHVIDSLWPGRAEVADFVFTLLPRAQWRLSALAQAIHAKQTAKAAVKALTARWRAD